MPVYYINSYDIINEEEFKEYPALVAPLLLKYGAEVLAVDTEAISLEGKASKMNAVIRFPDEDTALRCYNSDEYQPMKALRQRTTSNCTMILLKGRD